LTLDLKVVGIALLLNETFVNERKRERKKETFCGRKKKETFVKERRRERKKETFVALFCQE
jgi:hypothetical protein